MNILTESYCEFKFRKRKREIERILGQFFNLPVKLKRIRRQSSRDSIYAVIGNKKIIAVARVRNEFRLRVLSKNLEDFKKKLAKSKKAFETEWLKYSRASFHSLTPKPLYKGKDFMVNEYINAPTAVEVLRKDWNKFESVLIQVVKNMEKLHKLGIVHGDAALHNCLLPDNENCIFIDMEGDYDGLKEEDKLIFDYLLLAETTIKFLPKGYRRIEPWVKIYQSYIKSKFEAPNISRFKKILHRLNELDPDLKNLEEAFI